VHHMLCTVLLNAKSLKLMSGAPQSCKCGVRDISCIQRYQTRENMTRLSIQKFNFACLYIVDRHLIINFGQEEAYEGGGTPSVIPPSTARLMSISFRHGDW
jgi:hypothetical protein